MLGWFYIGISVLLGLIFCSTFFPGLKKITKVTYSGNGLRLSSIFVCIPAWYLTGTLIVTWTTYLLAYWFKEEKEPLFLANIIAMPLFLIGTFLYFGFKLRQYWKSSMGASDTVRNPDHNRTGGFILPSTSEKLFLISVLILAFLLMWLTFFIKGDKLYVGATVFGDFSPHLGMIRSFSEGNNFPTWYSHFAGEDIRYHFMFFFMVGNLEYLGLPLDFAFNIPSMLSYIGAFMLLYVLAVKITESKWAGYLTCLFFAFRSSKSLFTLLSQVPEGSSIIKALVDNTEFIGDTTNENWGLFNLNVYCNQRHLAFSIGIMLLAILLFLPHLYDLFQKMKNKSEEKTYLQTFLLSRGPWVIKDIRLAVGMGFILGMIAFWNGSVLIATLSILFLVGLCCERRMELLVTAMIAVILTLLQSAFFMQGNPVSPKYFFGFIAENKTLFGVIDYLFRLLGILPFLLFAAFMASKPIKRYIILAFLVPLILTFTLSLTVDVTVNHKFLMLSVMLLGLMISDYLVGLFKRRDLVMKIGVGFMVILMTAPGIYDIYTLIKKNNPVNAVVLDLDSNLTQWVMEHSDSKDIFLSSNYSLNQIVLGGGMLFEGWQYYGWSAGYDTVGRDLLVKEMYEATTSKELQRLVQENNIRFIVVDFDNRNSEAYHLNESTIQDTYGCVYTEGIDDYELSIFDTEIYLANE